MPIGTLERIGAIILRGAHPLDYAIPDDEGLAFF